MKKILTLSILMIVFALGNVQAVVLQVNSSGILTGATGVNVGGTMYDVAFVDGTCAQAYGACDNTHFSFHDLYTGKIASQALLDQVFIDSDLGAFDSNTNLLYGITSTDYSRTFTMIGVTTGYNFSTEALNWSSKYYQSGYSDQAYVYGGTDLNRLTADFGKSPKENWAVWSLSSADVPEPGILALFLAGLSSIVVIRRRSLVA